MNAPLDPSIKAAAERILRWRQGGPCLYAVEVLGVPQEWDPVRKAGIQDWQWKANEILVKKHRLSIRSGHGVGKSAFLAWTVLWFLTCYFPCRIPCTAPTGHQLKDVLWSEIAKWLRIMEERAPDMAAQFEWMTEEVRLRDAPKESFAAARTARQERPEALQGFHAHGEAGGVLVVVDEASGVPDVIFEVGEGVLTSENTFVVMAANPTRTSGYFHDSHHKMRHRWGTLHVSCADSPLVSNQYIEDMGVKYGKDSNIYRVRVLGEFPTGNDDAVIPLDWVTSAIHREVDGFGPTLWGLDVARFGSDRSALAKRNRVRLLEKVKWWRNKDTMQIAGLVYAEWLDTPPDDRPLFIFVDVIGLGAGVVDRLSELGLPVIGINVSEEPSIAEQFLRLRDEMWFRGREWFRLKACSLVDDEELVAELSFPKYTITSTGKKKVQTKEEIKKAGLQSPDLADAFLLTFMDAPELNRGRQSSYEPQVFSDGV